MQNIQNRARAEIYDPGGGGLGGWWPGGRDKWLTYPSSLEFGQKNYMNNNSNDSNNNYKNKYKNNINNNNSINQ